MIDARSRLSSLVLAAAMLFASSGAAGAADVAEFVWVDLLTEDAETAIAFYSGLFGWTVADSPTGSTLVYHQDLLIAGISEIEDRIADVDEARWLVGIAVPDLDGAVASAHDRGAKIHREVTPVAGYARYALIEDPRGALLLLLDPERPLGGPRGAGSWVWVELWTDDPDASTKFYADVLGYERGETELAVGTYTVFSAAGEPRAGLVAFDDEAIRPAWAPYVGVEDLAATIASARELGGRVLLEPAPELSGGSVALLSDPTGGGFFVYQLPEATP